MEEKIHGTAETFLILPEGIYEPNAEAVEYELDGRFTKVVLAPMIDWDGGESPVYTKPAILTTSFGAVVGQDDRHTQISPTRLAHNPESDEITLLIDNIASQIDYLHEGMPSEVPGFSWFVKEIQLLLQRRKVNPRSQVIGISTNLLSSFQASGPSESATTVK